MTWLTLHSSNTIYACPSLVQSNVNQRVTSGIWCLYVLHALPLEAHYILGCT